MSEPESQKIHDTRVVLLWRPYNLCEEIREEEEKDEWHLRSYTMEEKPFWESNIMYVMHVYPSVYEYVIHEYTPDYEIDLPEDFKIPSFERFSTDARIEQLSLKNELLSERLRGIEVEYIRVDAKTVKEAYYCILDNCSRTIVKQAPYGSFTTEKKPTIVLIKNVKKIFGAFGYEAEDKDTDLVEKDGNQNWYFFRLFRMMKYENLPERNRFEEKLKTKKSQPRHNETGGKASKLLYDRSAYCFGVLVKRKELPKTDTKKSPKQLWMQYCQAELPGESKTLLSKPLYDKRPETENFINSNTKPVEHCTSAEKYNAIIPDNDRLLCKVCYMNELSIVFLPCSHMVACRRCAARLKTCPVCRSGIKEALPANLHE